MFYTFIFTCQAVLFFTSGCSFCCFTIIPEGLKSRFCLSVIGKKRILYIVLTGYEIIKPGHIAFGKNALVED
jgi:hypothetical protein